MLGATLGEQVTQALINLIAITLVGGLAGLLWADISRRGASRRAALDRFYYVYGQWFGTWKAWTALCRRSTAPKDHELPLEPPSGSTDRDKSIQIYKMRLELHHQAVEAEGELEALLLMIVLERRLTGPEKARLGQFRQGYQYLRTAIERNAPIQWWVRDSEDTYTVPLVLFKALAAEFGFLLANRQRLIHPRTWCRPSQEEAQRAFVEITSWQTAKNKEWWLSDGKDDAGVINSIERLNAIRARTSTSGR